MSDIRGAASEQLKEFWIVDDLRPFRVGEHRRKNLQRFALLVKPHGAPFAGLRGHLDRSDARAEAFGFALAHLEIQPDSQRLLRGKLPQIFAEFDRACELRVVRLRGGFRIRRRGRGHGFRTQLSEQGIETEFAVQRCKSGAIGFAALQRVQIQFQRHIDGNRRELLGHHHLLALLLERFAITLVRDFIGMIQRLLHAAIFLDQLGRAFFADPLRARNVVDGIAQQRHQIDYSFGWNTENFFHFFFVDDDVCFCAARSRPQRSNVFPDKLHHVLVVADDQHLELFLRGLHRQRANNVVGLVTLKLQDRQAHRFAQLSNVGNLHGEVVGHRRALRFVLFKQLVAERRALGVENDAHVIRLVVLDEAPKNVQKKKRHFRGNAGGRVHPVHRRVKGAVDVRHRIDKEQLLGCRRHAREYSKGLTGDSLLL